MNLAAISQSRQVIVSCVVIAILDDDAGRDGYITCPCSRRSVLMAATWWSSSTAQVGRCQCSCRMLPEKYPRPPRNPVVFVFPDHTYRMKFPWMSLTPPRLTAQKCPLALDC